MQLKPICDGDISLDVDRDYDGYFENLVTSWCKNRFKDAISINVESDEDGMSIVINRYETNYEYRDRKKYEEYLRKEEEREAILANLELKNKLIESKNKLLKEVEVKTKLLKEVEAKISKSR